MVAVHASVGAKYVGKIDVSRAVYAVKCVKSPHPTCASPGRPHNPNRSATADRKDAPRANLKNIAL